VYNDEKTIVYLNCDILLSNIVTYAQKENNPFTEIALTQAKRKDDFQGTHDGHFRPF
jgi:hypothetical protein